MHVPGTRYLVYIFRVLLTTLLPAPLLNTMHSCCRLFQVSGVEYDDEPDTIARSTRVVHAAGYKRCCLECPLYPTPPLIARRQARCLLPVCQRLNELVRVPVQRILVVPCSNLKYEVTSCTSHSNGKTPRGQPVNREQDTGSTESSPLTKVRGEFADILYVCLSVPTLESRAQFHLRQLLRVWSLDKKMRPIFLASIIRSRSCRRETNGAVCYDPATL